MTDESPGTREPDLDAFLAEQRTCRVATATAQPQATQAQRKTIS
jgi:hypothetical protein